MKLSIVIICWNDLRVVKDCLRSIFENTKETEFEVIVSDNGSTDGSIEYIRTQFPAVHLIENGANLGFAKANNIGIKQAQGEYILILNPDTIIHSGSLDRWISFAKHHSEAGAFACKVLRADGTYWPAARPFPTVKRAMIAALGLGRLARFGVFGHLFLSNEYDGWDGNNEREVDWQSGCCILFCGEILRELGGFDEQFFYCYEEVDLCRRVWQAGYTIRYTPASSITHLGGQSVGRFPVRFALEANRNCYRYFYKHFGAVGARRCKRILLIHFRLRRFAYGLRSFLKPSESLNRRLEMYRTVTDWNQRIDPVQFVEHGIEPNIARA
jgi:hypothetical protein